MICGVRRHRFSVPSVPSIPVNLYAEGTVYNSLLACFAWNVKGTVYKGFACLLRLECKRHGLQRLACFASLGMQKARFTTACLLRFAWNAKGTVYRGLLASLRLECKRHGLQRLACFASLGMYKARFTRLCLRRFAWKSRRHSSPD